MEFEFDNHFIIPYHLIKEMPTFTKKKQRGDQGHFGQKFFIDQRLLKLRYYIIKIVTFDPARRTASNELYICHTKIFHQKYPWSPLCFFLVNVGIFLPTSYDIAKWKSDSDSPASKTPK